MFLSQKAGTATIILALANVAFVAGTSCGIGLYVLNADDDTDVGSLFDLDDDVHWYCIPSHKFNIEARPNEYCEKAESALMLMTDGLGSIISNRTENKVPWTVFGDDPNTGDIWGECLEVPAIYVVEAKLYSEVKLQGKLVVSLQYSFYAHYCDCQVEYILWDADLDTPVKTLVNGDCIQYNSRKKYTIQAKPTSDCPKTESAYIKLDGPTVYSKTENSEPYTVFGNSAGNLFG